MRATEAALCSGTVWHRRNYPTVNEFTYRASHVWIDPDRPEDITDNSRFWSASGPAPARFRRSDYGMDASGVLGEHLRRAAEAELGMRPSGPIRMLSQVRRFGWLFNPITVYVLWDDDPDRPTVAIAEVTNTPWKERTHYVLALESTVHPTGDEGATAFTTEFDKDLHVSPFLGMDYRYGLTLLSSDPELTVRIDVIDRESRPIVETALAVTRREPTSSALGRSVVVDSLRTRHVSAAIHAQAAKLAAKRVPFVPHPRTQSPTSTKKEPSNQ